MRCSMTRLYNSWLTIGYLLVHWMEWPVHYWLTTGSLDGASLDHLKWSPPGVFGGSPGDWSPDCNGPGPRAHAHAAVGLRCHCTRCSPLGGADVTTGHETKPRLVQPSCCPALIHDEMWGMRCRDPHHVTRGYRDTEYKLVPWGSAFMYRYPSADHICKRQLQYLVIVGL